MGLQQHRCVQACLGFNFLFFSFFKFLYTVYGVPSIIVPNLLEILLSVVHNLLFSATGILDQYFPKVGLNGANTADYKGLRVKTRNFVFLPNATRTLLFHKLLTTSEHTMNIEIISFYVSKECKNMQSLLQLSSVVMGLISELGQSD